MSPNQRLLRRSSPAHPKDDGPQQDPILRPREAMRRSHCQDYHFHLTETYPSILAQVSRCDPSKNTHLLEADGCGRPLGMTFDEHPRQDTLAFYGVGSPLLQPESVMFNQALMASLSKAGIDGTRRRSKRPTPPTPPKKTPISGNSVHNQMCQPLILNRQALQTELQQMPIVQQRLHPRTAFETVFCSPVVDPTDPFGIAQHKEMMISRDQALGMERPPNKIPRGLRRRHWYCPSDCGGEQNACCQYEWAKYNLDPRPYNKEFREWLSEQKAISSPEPKDYDQLYERFLKCFEQKPSPDPLCNAYEICCATKDSHGDDGQGGGDGHGGGGGGSGRPGGEGDGDGSTGEIDGTGDKDKAKDGNKNKKKDTDNDKDTETDKDKDKDKNKDKNKDMDKEKFNDKFKDNTDKNKDKDKDTGKEVGDGKDKGKDGFTDKDDTGGDGKLKNKDNEKGNKKNKKEADNDKPTKIPDWHSDEPIKVPSWMDGDPEPEAKVPDKKLVPDSGKDGTGYDFDIKLKVPDTPAKIKPGKGKKNKEKEKGKASDKNKGKTCCKTCPPAGCSCEICDFMNRFRGEPDAPFIREMKLAEKKRQLKDYTRQMCHREYIRNRCQQDLQNPHFEKHRDCLSAVQDLEKVIAGCRQDNGFDQKLLNLVENLCRRIYQRMRDCSQPHPYCYRPQYGF